MKGAALGTTELQVTAAGLGTVQLGMPYGLGLPEPPPDDEAVAFLHRALDLGIPLPELAVRFAAAESQADVTLFGTTSIEELSQNLQALERGPLPPDAVAAIRRIEVSSESLLHPGNWNPPPPDKT